MAVAKADTPDAKASSTMHVGRKALPENFQILLIDDGVIDLFLWRAETHVRTKRRTNQRRQCESFSVKNRDSGTYHLDSGGSYPRAEDGSFIDDTEVKQFKF